MTVIKHSPWFDDSGGMAMIVQLGGQGNGSIGWSSDGSMTSNEQLFGDDRQTMI